MVLYLLDFKGTLDTLPSPADYIKALRSKHNYECMIIVVSGTHVIGEVAEAADDVWSKDEAFLTPLREIYGNGWREVVVCDDMPSIMRTYNRALQRMGFTVTLVHPDDLMALLM